MSSRRERGLTLLEVVVFIVVLGIGIAALAVIYNQLTLASVDPLVRKQAVAIANSLMEEVQLRPFTYCDPDDAAVFTAPAPGGCGVPEGIGTEGPETRYGPTFFDNVGDYHGFTMPAGIQDIVGAPVAGLEAYAAQVAIADGGGDFPGGTVPAPEALRVTVTVSGPANVRVVLHGYRLRYAPNSP